MSCYNNDKMSMNKTLKYKLVHLVRPGGLTTWYKLSVDTVFINTTNVGDAKRFLEIAIDTPCGGSLP